VEQAPVTWTDQAMAPLPVHAINARVVQQEAPGELLMVTAWSMTAQWVAGVWAQGPLGAEVGMTTSG